MKVLLIRTNGFDGLLAVDEENKTVHFFHEQRLQSYYFFDEDGEKVYLHLSKITKDFDETRGEALKWEEWKKIESELCDCTSRNFEILEEIELQ